jgi:hypothetical protein
METETTPGTVAKAVLQTCNVWRLTTAQTCLLFGIDDSTLQRWAMTPPALEALPEKLIERISHILGVFKALQILLPDPVLADDWIHRPNSADPFNGQRPLDLMLSAEGLIAVRQYLDQESV